VFLQLEQKPIEKLQLKLCKKLIVVVTSQASLGQPALTNENSSWPDSPECKKYISNDESTLHTKPRSETRPRNSKTDVICTLVTNPPPGGFVITGMYQIAIIIYRHVVLEQSILKPKENL